MSEVKCHKCSESVKERIVTALGKSWHPEHFVCRECDTPIKESTFNEKDGEPVCKPCYTKMYSDICHFCKCPINEKIIKALGNSWHEEHFVCDGPCKKPLSGTAFYEREGKAYCKEDFEKMFAPRCKSCTLPITDKAVIALDAKWHKDCFKCQKCNNPITSSTFTVDGGLPVCTDCANV